MTLQFKPTRSQLERLAELLQPLLQAGNQPDPFDHALADFLFEVYKTGLIVPFDWLTYVASREALMKDRAALQSMDAETFQRIVTAHVRMDRFLQGHLRYLAESGYLAAVAARARELAAAS